MIISVPKSFVAFLISSAFKSIVEFRIYYWIRLGMALRNWQASVRQRD